MRKLIVILIALMAYGSQVLADKVTFTASAPDAVVVGEQFKLSFTVTTQNVKEFQIPAIKGFDVLMGPAVQNRVVHKSSMVMLLPQVLLCSHIF